VQIQPVSPWTVKLAAEDKSPALRRGRRVTKTGEAMENDCNQGALGNKFSSLPETNKWGSGGKRMTIREKH